MNARVAAGRRPECWGQRPEKLPVVCRGLRVAWEGKSDKEKGRGRRLGAPLDAGPSGSSRPVLVLQDESVASASLSSALGLRRRASCVPRPPGFPLPHQPRSRPSGRTARQPFPRGRVLSRPPCSTRRPSTRGPSRGLKSGSTTRARASSSARAPLAPGCPAPRRSTQSAPPSGTCEPVRGPQASAPGPGSEPWTLLTAPVSGPFPVLLSRLGSKTGTDQTGVSSLTCPARVPGHTRAVTHGSVLPPAGAVLCRPDDGPGRRPDLTLPASSFGPVPSARRGTARGPQELAGCAVPAEQAQPPLAVPLRLRSAPAGGGGGGAS